MNLSHNKIISRIVGHLRKKAQCHILNFKIKYNSTILSLM